MRHLYIKQLNSTSSGSLGCTDCTLSPVAHQILRNTKVWLYDYNYSNDKNFKNGFLSYCIYLVVSCVIYLMEG